MERFFDKVSKAKGRCWTWQAGTRGKTGYGAFKYKGKVVDAHRMSYIIHKGYIPDGFLVCHTCDNRLCVNPDHLVLGTWKDNHQDGISRGKIKPNANQHLRKHPGYGAYNRGCRCADCKKIHNEAARRYRNKK